MRKPFNLANALAGHAVVNGYGVAVEQFAYFPSNTSPYKIYALVRDTEGDSVETYTEDGKYCVSDASTNSDLYMLVPDPKPEPRKVYVNVWRNDDVFGVIHATVHHTSEQAAAERTTSCSGKKKVFIGQKTFEY